MSRRHKQRPAKPRDCPGRPPASPCFALRSAELHDGPEMGCRPRRSAATRGRHSPPYIDGERRSIACGGQREGRGICSNQLDRKRRLRKSGRVHRHAAEEKRARSAAHVAFGSRCVGGDGRAGQEDDVFICLHSYDVSLFFYLPRCFHRDARFMRAHNRLCGVYGAGVDECGPKSSVLQVELVGGGVGAYARAGGMAHALRAGVH